MILNKMNVHVNNFFLRFVSCALVITKELLFSLIMNYSSISNVMRIYLKPWSNK